MAIQKEIADAAHFAAENQYQQALDHYNTALALGEDLHDEQLGHELALAKTRRDEVFAFVQTQRKREQELVDEQGQLQAQIDARHSVENQRRNLEGQTTATNRELPQQDRQVNARAVEEACLFITKTIERKSHVNYGLFSELFVHRITVTPRELKSDVTGTSASFLEGPRPAMEWVTTQAISFKDVDPEGVLLRRLDENEFVILLRTTNGKKSGTWNNVTRNRPDLKSKTGVLPPETSTESIDVLTFDVSNVSSDDREALTSYFRLLASSAGGKISSPKLARLEQWGENLNAPFQVGDEVTGSDFISGVIISVGQGVCRVKVTETILNSAYRNGSTYDFLIGDLKKTKPPRVN
ncbi:MAG: hypothetical protein KDA90_17045 [Planctomycetaceae bacterium]|nr:hypothetical protein [Planctomycetaceae bacterium]